MASVPAASSKVMLSTTTSVMPPGAREILVALDISGSSNENAAAEAGECGNEALASRETQLCDSLCALYSKHVRRYLRAMRLC